MAAKQLSTTSTAVLLGLGQPPAGRSWEGTGTSSLKNHRANKIFGVACCLLNTFQIQINSGNWRKICLTKKGCKFSRLTKKKWKKKIEELFLMYLSVLKLRFEDQKLRWQLSCSVMHEEKENWVHFLLDTSALWELERIKLPLKSWMNIHYRWYSVEVKTGAIFCKVKFSFSYIDSTLKSIPLFL